jgi:hypothetical protein
MSYWAIWRAAMPQALLAKRARETHNDAVLSEHNLFGDQIQWMTFVIQIEHLKSGIKPTKQKLT